MKLILSKLLLSITLFSIFIPLNAEISLPSILQSNMVLQRNSDVVIWGWASPGEKVTIYPDWSKKRIKTVAQADGSWQVKIYTGKAGGPHQLKIKGENIIVLNNILFGEVWLCSGQSNMDFTIQMLGGWDGPFFENDKQDFLAHDYSGIRLFDVANTTSVTPEQNCQGSWDLPSLERLNQFSAVAYFFGRRLYKELNIPVGLIVSSWGGTSAQAWTRSDIVNSQPELAFYRYDPARNYAPQAVPGALYNGMIHPLLNFRIAGVTWYQGEANRNDAETYPDLFMAMISNWRKDFNQGPFPFYYVQIAPYRYDEPMAGALIREAQLKCTTVPQTGMVVTLDIGDFNDIHPVNKQEVGRRLALQALAKTYGQTERVCEGPIYVDDAVEEIPWLEAVKGVKLQMDPRGDGMKLADQGEGAFEICGTDGVFLPAHARIQGNSIYVWNTDVRHPESARYGFTNTPNAVLFNTEGFPASSFRTDRLPVVTGGVRIETVPQKPGATTTVKLTPANESMNVRYTLDGTDPDFNDANYDHPFEVKETTCIKARAFKGSVPSVQVDSARIIFHMASGAKMSLKTPFSPKYPASGSMTLLDGIRGSSSYSDGRWLGFEGNDLEVFVDLGTERDISTIQIGFLQASPSWVFLPEQVSFSASENGNEFQELEQVYHQVDPKSKEIIRHDFKMVSSIQVRYLRIRAKNMGTCPEWHTGAGDKAWIFCDEIIVE